MFDTIALLIVSGGLAAFMANRLYVMAVYKVIGVKGQHYERSSNPFLFWFFVGAFCLSFAFGTALFFACIAMALGSI
jgi:hypothetical protein